MSEVTLRMDSGDIEAAARALDVWDPSLTPARLAREVISTVAGTRKVSAIAAGGAAPKRAGREWENAVVARGQAAGLPWDRAPLRGRADLLDVTGCLPDGWLVGCKSANRGTSAARKMFDAMDQSRRAMDVLEQQGKADDVIPWQIVRRPGVDVDQAYAVTEFGWMLRICQLRRDGWKGPR